MRALVYKRGLREWGCRSRVTRCLGATKALPDKGMETVSDELVCPVSIPGVQAFVWFLGMSAHFREDHKENPDCLLASVASSMKLPTQVQELYWILVKFYWTSFVFFHPKTASPVFISCP